MVKSKTSKEARKALYNAPTHVQEEDSLLPPQRGADQKEYRQPLAPGSSRATPLRSCAATRTILGVEGKVTDVNTQTGRIIIEGVTITKADGTRSESRSVHASNGHDHQAGPQRPLEEGKAPEEGGFLMSNDMKRLTAPRELAGTRGRPTSGSPSPTPGAALHRG